MESKRILLKSISRFLLLLMFLSSCNNDSATMSTEDKKDSIDVKADSVSATATGTGRDRDDSTIQVDTTISPLPVPDTVLYRAGRNPASIPVPEEETAKGYAMVYCPIRMINKVPSILYAAITKEEINAAFKKFAKKVGSDNPGKNEKTISRDIKGDTIDIYEKMGVAIEFDSTDFAQISKNIGQVKQFNNNVKTLEWEWIIKPLHSTQRSIIRFNFFYIDPDNKENYFFNKTINVSVTVDARSYFDKWKDFLFEDPKTTITVIIVPLVTFLGGFLFGKKRDGKK